MKTYLSFVLCLGFFLMSMSSSAQRNWGRRDGYYHRDYDRDYDRYYYAPAYHRSFYPGLSVLASLPFGAIGVTLGGLRYHYYDGLYYRPGRSGFMIVEPPVGIIVPRIPHGSVSVVIGTRPYYVYDDTYYLPLGDNSYQVVPRPHENVTVSTPPPPPAAAPSDGPAASYDKVVIEGKTYYKKGDTYYKATVSGNGEVRYESVGQVGK